MWITFKICTFVTSNNLDESEMGKIFVVNYFQNLYLCDSQQLVRSCAVKACSCELLSKFVSLWLPTTSIPEKRCTQELWITFKICIFVIFNNLYWPLRIANWVVNYFQNLYLCDWEQPAISIHTLAYSCELLSKFVSLWLRTTGTGSSFADNTLWITFKICIFVTSNNLNFS